MDEFRSVVKNPGNAIVIDVREANEYQNGFVTGALNIPRGLLEFKIWKQLGYPVQLDKSRKIYLYCKQGQRSLLSAVSLMQLGFSHVIAVDMKISEWEEAGYPFEF
jgi:rhodanese-related sulfurtransferase